MIGLQKEMEMPTLRRSKMLSKDTIPYPGQRDLDKEQGTHIPWTETVLNKIHREGLCGYPNSHGEVLVRFMVVDVVIVWRAV